MFSKNLIINLFIVSLAFCLVGPITASAASTPSLGAAATYGVLSDTYTNPTGPTTITGDVGFTTAPAISPLGTHANYGFGTPYSTAGADQATALAALNSGANATCDFTFAAGAIDLATDTTHVPSFGSIIGEYTPGVYCIDGAVSIGTAGITLNGIGTYIFRSTGALNTVSSSSVTLSGTPVASACDVFWTPNGAATINANSKFIGTVIPASQDITVYSTTTWSGRALAFGHMVTTPDSGVAITVPTSCAVPPTTCSSFTYSAWSACSGGNQSRTVATSSPSGCTGGTPVLTQSCAVPVDGTCGTAATSYLSTDVAFSGTMCGLGNGVTTPASPTFPTAGNSVTWTCAGSNGGSSSGTCTTSVASAPVTTATLTLVKTIVNIGGGTRTFADFPLTATGLTAVNGVYGTATVLNQSVIPGTYTLSETTQSNYTAGTWSCLKNVDPVAVTGASITLVAGDNAICTVQNTYIAPAAPSGGGGNSYGISTPVAPLIDVVKIPSPLALPAGPGLVNYTYTLSNIGTVSMNNVTIVDDSCSPVKYISGDMNGDSKLDTTEKWTYTCSATLSATHTNTVTAIGWANGVSSTDIATATVVVGSSVVPPLIHVTKVPSPLALPAGGGMVTYTKKVTNPGTVPLSNVQLVDDKCGPVKYISGDTNGDSKLDPSETWTYTCSAKLTKTTTNTVVATGQANGLTARDFAIATVVVASPKLPNTGFPPEEKNNIWSTVMFAGILILVSGVIAQIITKLQAKLNK